jgi:8-oxo-dGTP pyrophosphatase MutT (NUDIX family)
MNRKLLFLNSLANSAASPVYNFYLILVMDLSSLIEHIGQRLQEPLPGRKAQLSLFSEQGLSEYKNRFQRYEQEVDPATTRQSGVMIMLYEKEGKIFFPLIQRPEYDGVHSGQIALPGGKKEESDKDIIETALRETFEEVGIEKSEIQILGTLTPVYIPPSRFWVNVVLGYHSAIPSFTPDDHEVASIIEFPLTRLFEENNFEERGVITSGNLTMKAPGYLYQDYFIWGATSMILGELKEVVRG